MIHGGAAVALTLSLNPPPPLTRCLYHASFSDSPCGSMNPLSANRRRELRERRREEDEGEEEGEEERD